MSYITIENEAKVAARTSLMSRANALADAEAVIVLKRPWTKGHFRYVLADPACHTFFNASDA